VRTPLNAIINFMEIALEGPLDKETRENLSQSHVASKSLIYAINDLLDLTRTEQGQDLVKEEEFDLIQTARETVNAFNGDIVKKGLMVDVLVSPNFPAVVTGDELLMRQCISNLLSNAVKYTDQGGIAVELRIVGIPEAGKVDVEIVVQDTGIGMSAEDMDILFRQLEQVQIDDELSLKAQDDEAGGGYILTKSSTKKLLGLGIAKVGRIIQTIGGQLRVTSGKGKGSRFTMQIPLSLPISLLGSHGAPRLLPRKAKSEKGLEVTLVDYNKPKQFTRQTQRLQSTRGAGYENPLIPRHYSASELDGLASVRQNIVPGVVTPSGGYFSAVAGGDSLEQGGAGLLMPPEVLKRASQPNPPRVPGILDLQKEGAEVAAAPSNASATTAVNHKIQTAVKEASPTNKQSIEKESDRKPLSVLVAEDNPINSLIIRKRLEKLGYSVKLTVNGQQCADAFKVGRGRYDLVLMDMQVSGAFYLPSIVRLRRINCSHRCLLWMAGLQQLSSARSKYRGRVAAAQANLAMICADAIKAEFQYLPSQHH